MRVLSVKMLAILEDAPNDDVLGRCRSTFGICDAVQIYTYSRQRLQQLRDLFTVLSSPCPIDVFLGTLATARQRLASSVDCPAVCPAVVILKRRVSLQTTCFPWVAKEVLRLAARGGASLYGDLEVYAAAQSNEYLGFAVPAWLLSGGDATSTQIPRSLHEVSLTTHLPRQLAERVHFPKIPGYTSCHAAIDSDGARLCVRYVDYHIDDQGNYVLRGAAARSRNYLCTWNAALRRYHDFRELRTSSPRQAPQQTPRQEARASRPAVLGIEDLRLQAGFFSGNTLEFSYCDRRRIVHGQLASSGTRSTFEVLRPPADLDDRDEKNWLQVDARHYIYEWHPFRLGRVVRGELRIVAEWQTPLAFRNLRGSAPPFELGGMYWVLCHVLFSLAPRRYGHVILVLDRSLRPVQVTQLFHFFGCDIEYCLGARPRGELLCFFVSRLDRETHYVEVPLEVLRGMLRDI